MQTLSIHKTVNYAIIGADYKYGINNKKQRTEALDKLNVSLDAFRNENSLYFEPQNVLVLWKNNPDEKYLSKKLGHSNDTLIKMFCERIVYESKTKPVQLFIDTPMTLLVGGKTNFAVLERLIAIWKETQIIPVLLDDDFISLDSNAIMGREGWRTKWCRTNENITFSK